MIGERPCKAPPPHRATGRVRAACRAPAGDFWSQVYLAQRGGGQPECSAEQEERGRSVPTYTLAELNSADEAAFVAALGWVFEGSPWVAQRAWAARPFASVAALHAAMVRAVERASPAEQLAL